MTETRGYDAYIDTLVLEDGLSCDFLQGHNPHKLLDPDRIYHKVSKEVAGTVSRSLPITFDKL